MSYASNRLFHDMLSGIGGVAFFDEVAHPNAKERRIVKIEVMVPYDNRKTGVERWTIKHDGDETVSYLVKFVPDGHGGTTFSVKHE